MDQDAPVAVKPQETIETTVVSELEHAEDTKVESDQAEVPAQAEDTGLESGQAEIPPQEPVSCLQRSKKFCTVALFSASVPPIDRGSCDTFIKLTFGEQTYSSEVRRRTMAPVWNQLFCFEHRPGYSFRYPGLELEVYDYNDIFVNTLVGKVLIEWRHVAYGGLFNVPILKLDAGEPQIVGSVMFKMMNAEVTKDGFVQGHQFGEDDMLKDEVQKFFAETRDDIVTDLAAERTLPRPPVKVSHILERSAGYFTVVLLSGTGLPKVDWIGCCDPYVKFLVGDRTLAESIWLRETMSPIWNQLFSFDVNPEELESSEGVTLEVWDHNNHNPDKYIGSIFLKWPHMQLGGIFRVPIYAGSMPGEVTEDKAGMLEFQIFNAKVILDGFTQGFVINDEDCLEMHRFAEKTENDEITDVNVEREIPQQTFQADDWFAVSEEHILLAVLSASGLPKMDLFGLSDPYVKIYVGEQMDQTTTKLVTLSPTWDQLFQFPLDLSSVSAAPHVVWLEVWDYDMYKSHDHIGDAFLKWEDFDGTEKEIPLYKKDQPPQEEFRQGWIKILGLKCQIINPEFKQGMKINPGPFQERLRAALGIQPAVMQITETLEVTHLENIEVVVTEEVKSET